MAERSTHSQKRIAVVGGGIAGITAAVHLLRHCYVDIYEATPQLGGRVRSFFSKDFNLWLDNGPHLLLGAYENTRWLLTQLNSERQLSPIPFAVHFHHASNDIRSVISNASLPGPLHLLPGLLKKGFFSPLQILRLGFALKRSARYLHPIPALDWLQSLGFNKTQLERFWSPLIRSVMNNDMDRVPADLLHIVLNQGFLNGSRMATFYEPVSSWREVFHQPALNLFEKSSGRVFLNTKIRKIDSGKNVTLYHHGSETYDAVIVATAAGFIPNIEGMPAISEQLNYSPINSSYFTTSEPLQLPGKMNYFYGSEVEWLFDRNTQGIYGTSTANDAKKIEQNEMESIIKRFAPGRWRMKNYKQIIVKKATPVFLPGQSLHRETAKLKNVAFAGDWTQTGLPATIEGAATSGRSAAQKILSKIDL
jgi:predicted NAD/FAD-binding protein